MPIEFGLAKNNSDMAEVVAKIAAASGIPSAGTALAINETTGVSFRFRGTNEDNEAVDPMVQVEQTESGATTIPLMSESTSAMGLAWEIISFSSGDTIVKFATNPTKIDLDIMFESFQSWGIPAYGINPAGGMDSFLTYKTLQANDLLKGQKYGGFMIHKMKKSGYGLTVFELESRAPIFTWTTNGSRPVSSDGQNVVRNYNTNGLSSYAELKRRYAGLHTPGSDPSDHMYYIIWCQEPYTKPKYRNVKYAVLAPIFCPGTAGDYAETARYVLQAPHTYNPFDGSHYIMVGESNFYSDFGACACATGEELSPTGLKVPNPNTMMYRYIGDYAPKTSNTDQGPYGEYHIPL